METTGLGQRFQHTGDGVQLKVRLSVVLQRVQDAMSPPMIFLGRGEVALVQIAPVASINEVLLGLAAAGRNRDEVVDRQLAAHLASAQK